MYHSLINYREHDTNKPLNHKLLFWMHVDFSPHSDFHFILFHNLYATMILYFAIPCAIYVEFLIHLHSKSQYWIQTKIWCKWFVFHSIWNLISFLLNRFYLFIKVEFSLFKKNFFKLNFAHFFFLCRFFADDDSGEKCVSVLLSGEESELTFIDHSYSEMTVSWLEFNNF